MAFSKMVKPKYPPRLWALAGPAGSGKSTFAAAMRAPLLLIDADHRFTEVLQLVKGDVYNLSENAADHVVPDAIAARLAENMPGAKVGTIVIDSLTAIIAPLTMQAIVDNENGKNKNKMAAFVDKAVAMRQLQDAVTRWGVDALWIWHLQQGRDESAKKVIKATISDTEIERLRRSLNVQLEIVIEGSKRGVKVAWARQGRSGMTIFDDTNTWVGMPEKIEAAIYDQSTTPGGDSKPARSAAPASSPAAPDQFVKPGSGAPGAPESPPAGNGTEPEAPTEAATKRKGYTWPALIVQAILREHLAENAPGAVGMLNKSKVLTPDVDHDRIIAWARVYRAERKADQTPDQAAAIADDALQAEPAAVGVE
jgi:hypothetical protein